jgi:hypothetical protein
MVIEMSWGSPWEGQASGEVPDIEAACKALRTSLRHVLLRGVEPSYRACLLRSACAELELRMSIEGRRALDAGKPWYATSGSVWVSLRPSEKPRPARMPNGA